MIKPKVGDYIRILVDGSYGTSELAGTKLKIRTVAASTITTETTSGVHCWFFDIDDLGKGKIELVTSRSKV